MSDTEQPLKHTALHALHQELGAKMVPFAGYDMPVSYPLGVKGEHLHTRAKCGLFDVSHMGQACLKGEGAAKALETVLPADIQGLKIGQQRYALLMNDQGGIRDDLMVTRMQGQGDKDALYLVVNAACKDQDFAYIAEMLEGLAELTRLEDRALIALQGPASAECLKVILGGEVTIMPFMSQLCFQHDGYDLIVSRSGYSGEDGYEISIPNDKADAFARALLALDDVEAIGLGARDSLRLEAGLCLYGQDIDETTSPVEAGLLWSIAKRRRDEGGFPGFQTVHNHITEGVTKRRVGILPDGRAPARAGTIVTNEAGDEIGVITSGGYGPSLEAPLAMGYVDAGSSSVDEKVLLIVRGKSLPARIVKMPFVSPNYYRG